jgi:flavin reductase (DIM6/NTAB) family NADH-FMN oxidoreductase RutF
MTPASESGFEPLSGPPSGPLSEAAFRSAMARWASGVALLCVADGRDDVGTTISSLMSVSATPPLLAVSVATDSYLGEVLERQDRWALSLLSSAQRALAGRFSAAGRPSARLLLAEEPHRRGAVSGALLLTGAVAALECAAEQRVQAGDHVLVVARVLAVDHLDPHARPLVHADRRYRTVT